MTGRASSRLRSGTGSMVERSLGVGEALGSIPRSPTKAVDFRGIAQLAERLVRDQEVLSSSLSTPTIFSHRRKDAAGRKGRSGVLFACPLRGPLTNH